MAKYFNITGELTQELVLPQNNVPVSSIHFTNIEGTYKCTVDLYIKQATSIDKFYLLKGVELPIGSTLVYNNVKFDKQFGLYIKLNKSASETPAVDVIIR